MAHSHNEFDGIAPNSQKDRRSRHAATVGFPWNRWDEVHSTSGAFDCVTISGVLVESYSNVVVEAPLVGNLSSYIVVHNLDSDFVDVQIYDTNKEIIQANEVVSLDKDRIRIGFIESQQGTVLIQKGKGIIL